MSFEIMYQFVGDKKNYFCNVNSEQYENFRSIPIIKECKIIKTNQ